MADAGTPTALIDAQRAVFARGAAAADDRAWHLAARRASAPDELLQAGANDFGGGAREEVFLLETFRLYIRHAVRHLDRWMRRVGGSSFLQPSRALSRHQPLNIVGVIGAWN
jgi:acyl-CoA reductase-like NAD-dependent aldehyde dehydrogenase